jgi:ABC-2 type transport system permease protein
MRAIVASEWLKLRRPGMLGALAAGTVALCVGTVAAVATAGSSSRGMGGATLPTIDELTSSHGLADALGVSSTLVGVVALAVSAAAWASEYTHGTLRHLLVWEPRRLRLLAGSWIGVAAAVAASVVAACVIASAAGVVAAGMYGYATSAWFTAQGGVSLAAAVGNLALAAVGWSLFGTVLAVAFRAPAAAIGVGVAYALPVEAILEGVTDGIAQWLPGELLTALAVGGNDTAGYGAALATLGAYTALAAGWALWTFQRTDVTA